jgi:drug/metabolite transporter (DMT)-like permease
MSMFAMARSTWIILIAVVLVTFANVMFKIRITALGEGRSSPWFSYVLSLALDPWVWLALIASVMAGLLYVVSLRQFELSVLEPLFALVFILVPLAAVVILGEHLPPIRIAGLVLIFVGVILVARTA